MTVVKDLRMTESMDGRPVKEMKWIIVIVTTNSMSDR